MAIWTASAPYRNHHVAVPSHEAARILASGHAGEDGFVVRLGDGDIKRVKTVFAPQPVHRGPNGRPLCRWCHVEIAARSRRRTFCSQSCVDDFSAWGKNWPAIRHRVWKRDRGVCSECRCDTNRAYAVWRSFWHTVGWSAAQEAARLIGWPDTLGRDWWEADHIKARRDGGLDVLENLRTLCVPCHKDRTRQQAHEWAHQRHAKTQLCLFQVM